MSLREIHNSDIGTVFRVTLYNNTVIFDASALTTKNLIFKKPDGTIITKEATFYTNGTDGIIEYKTVSGDLDQNGVWALQAYLETPLGSWKTSTTMFRVYDNLE